jgi:hypothetical protein
MSEREKRDEILAMVRGGEMSVEQAEQWAKANREIFSVNPDPSRFDPMKEQHWTLPMVGAWIVDRRPDAVRVVWDNYRKHQLSWRVCEVQSPEGHRIFGAELCGGAAATLREVLSESHRRTTDFKPDVELAFALRSGQLKSTGISWSRQQRVPIPKDAWLSPNPSSSGEMHEDPIYAADDRDDVYTEIEVDRDDVIGIWPELTPPGHRERSPTNCERASFIPTVKTLPPGFDRIDWTAEHVLAWLRYRNIAQLSTLELSDPNRPRYYGWRYRSGYVDSPSMEALREALITEKLVGMSSEHPISRGSWWRDKSILDEEKVWFRRDDVQRLWAERGSDGTQTVDTSFSSPKVSPATRTAVIEETLHSGRTRGPRPIERNRVIGEMWKDIESGHFTVAQLFKEKKLGLEKRYGTKSTTLGNALEEFRKWINECSCERHDAEPNDLRALREKLRGHGVIND